MGKVERPYLLTGLEPAAALRFFEDIARLPHGSADEGALADYLCQFAEERGLSYRRDKWQNVVIKKRGQGRNANVAPIALQGHTDMVCEKNEGVAHDFHTDPIPYYLDGEWVRAHGTTLGADDGLAIGIMLAVLDDDILPHPPLECVFTSQEELGMDGARYLSADWVSARRLINLDGGSEGLSTVSSAGGISVTVTVPFTRCPAEGEGLSVRLTGLTGGHSGGKISEQRANSNRLMGRLLAAAEQAAPLRMASLSGGRKDNAIPREAFALFCTENAEATAEAMQTLFLQLKQEYAKTDPDMILTIERAEPAFMMDEAASRKLVLLMQLLPDGVQHWNHQFALPTTSANLGVVETLEACTTVRSSIRSTSQTMQDEVQNKMLSAAKALGLPWRLSEAYPSWYYREDSPLRRLAAPLYRSTVGVELVFQATHGGLECGLFCEKWPDMDILSIGCLTEGVHSPDEALNLPSYEKLYLFVRRMLESLT